MKNYIGEKGRILQRSSVETMRAHAEASLLDDNSVSRRLANMLLDVLDGYNDEETNRALEDMYFHLVDFNDAEREDH